MIEGSSDSQPGQEHSRTLVPPLVTKGPPQATSFVTRATTIGPLATEAKQNPSGGIDPLSELFPQPHASALSVDPEGEGGHESDAATENGDDLPLLLPWTVASDDRADDARAGDLLEVSGTDPALNLGGDDWHDDDELPRLGEAVLEDEEPLREPLSGSVNEGQAGPDFMEAIAAVTGPSGSVDASHRAAEVAGRLERIARTLRDGGPKATLAEHANDPLGAMITGYLIGLAESSEE